MGGRNCIYIRFTTLSYVVLAVIMALGSTQAFCQLDVEAISQNDKPEIEVRAACEVAKNEENIDSATSISQEETSSKEQILSTNENNSESYIALKNTIQKNE